MCVGIGIIFVPYPPDYCMRLCGGGGEEREGMEGEGQPWDRPGVLVEGKRWDGSVARVMRETGTEVSGN